MSRWSGAQRQKQRSGKVATGGEGWVMKGGWRDGQNPDSSDLSASPRSLWFILQGTKTYILRSRTWCELKNKTKPSGNLDNLGRGPDEKQRVQAGGCWKSPGYTGKTTWDWGWGQRRGWSGQGRGIRVNQTWWPPRRGSRQADSPVSGLGDCGSRWKESAEWGQGHLFGLGDDVWDSGDVE